MRKSRNMNMPMWAAAVMVVFGVVFFGACSDVANNAGESAINITPPEGPLTPVEPVTPPVDPGPGVPGETMPEATYKYSAYVYERRPAVRVSATEVQIYYNANIGAEASSKKGYSGIQINTENYFPVKDSLGNPVEGQSIVRDRLNLGTGFLVKGGSYATYTLNPDHPNAVDNKPFTLYVRFGNVDGTEIIRQEVSVPSFLDVDLGRNIQGIYVSDTDDLNPQNYINKDSSGKVEITVPVPLFTGTGDAPSNPSVQVTLIDQNGTATAAKKLNFDWSATESLKVTNINAKALVDGPVRVELIVSSGSKLFSKLFYGQTATKDTVPAKLTWGYIENTGGADGVLVHFFSDKTADSGAVGGEPGIYTTSFTASASASDDPQTGFAGPGPFTGTAAYDLTQISDIAENVISFTPPDTDSFTMNFLLRDMSLNSSNRMTVPVPKFCGVTIDEIEIPVTKDAYGVTQALNHITAATSAKFGVRVHFDTPITEKSTVHVIVEDQNGITVKGSATVLSNAVEVTVPLLDPKGTLASGPLKIHAALALFTDKTGYIYSSPRITAEDGAVAPNIDGKYFKDVSLNASFTVNNETGNISVNAGEDVHVYYKIVERALFNGGTASVNAPTVSQMFLQSDFSANPDPARFPVAVIDENFGAPAPLTGSVTPNNIVTDTEYYAFVLVVDANAANVVDPASGEIGNTYGGVTTHIIGGDIGATTPPPTSPLTIVVKGVTGAVTSSPGLTPQVVLDYPDRNYTLMIGKELKQTLAATALRWDSATPFGPVESDPAGTKFALPTLGAISMTGVPYETISEMGVSADTGLYKHIYTFKISTREAGKTSQTAAVTVTVNAAPAAPNGNPLWPTLPSTYTSIDMGIDGGLTPGVLALGPLSAPGATLDMTPPFAPAVLLIGTTVDNAKRKDTFTVTLQNRGMPVTPAAGEPRYTVSNPRVLESSTSSNPNDPATGTGARNPTATPASAAIPGAPITTPAVPPAPSGTPPVLGTPTPVTFSVNNGTDGLLSAHDIAFDLVISQLDHRPIYYTVRIPIGEAATDLWTVLAVYVTGPAVAGVATPHPTLTLGSSAPNWTLNVPFGTSSVYITLDRKDADHVVTLQSVEDTTNEAINSAAVATATITPINAAVLGTDPDRMLFVDMSKNMTRNQHDVKITFTTSAATSATTEFAPTTYTVTITMAAM